MQRLASRLALLAVLALAAGGCGLVGERQQSSAFALPDLPRATRGLVQGEGLVFHGVTFALEDVSYDALAPQAVISAASASGRVEKSTALGSYQYFGDILARVVERPGAGGASARPGVTLALYHLPSLSAASAGAPGDLLVLQAGDLRFIEGGFVSLLEIEEHDPQLTSDDAALVSVGLDGKISEAFLREFQGQSFGAASLRLGNVWPTLEAGGGSAEVTVARGPLAWPGGGPASEVDITAGKTLDFQGLKIEATPIEQRGGTGWRVLVEAQDDIREGRAILVPGQGWRWGPWSILVRDVRPTGVSLSITRHDTDAFPLDQRARPERTSPVATTTGRAGPVDVTNELQVGSPFDVQGARFEIRRTFAGDVMNPNDDADEVLFRFGDASRSARITEGWRETFSGGGQWWVLEVQEVDPYPLPHGGKAKARIRYGLYSVPSPTRAPIVGQPAPGSAP